VDPRAGLDNMEKLKLLTLPGLEPRPLSRVFDVCRIFFRPWYMSVCPAPVQLRPSGFNDIERVYRKMLGLSVMHELIRSYDTLWCFTYYFGSV
jgi:hypothetical protein